MDRVSYFSRRIKIVNFSNTSVFGTLTNFLDDERAAKLEIRNRRSVDVNNKRSDNFFEFHHDIFVRKKQGTLSTSVSAARASMFARKKKKKKKKKPK